MMRWLILLVITIRGDSFCGYSSGGKTHYQLVQEGPPLVVTEYLYISPSDLLEYLSVVGTLVVIAPSDLHNQGVHVG